MYRFRSDVHVVPRFHQISCHGADFLLCSLPIFVEEIYSCGNVENKFALGPVGKRPVEQSDEKEESIQIENFPVI